MLRLRTVTVLVLVLVSFALAGCSGGDGGTESTAATAQAQTGGAADVAAVLAFDDESMLLVAQRLDGTVITAQYTATTLNLEASPREHPPTPIHACRVSAEKWNDQIESGEIAGKGITGMLGEHLERFAELGCYAHVSVVTDDRGAQTVASLQPLP
jgi:hypothetical protein